MCFGMFLGEGPIGINEKVNECFLGKETIGINEKPEKGCVPNVSWEGKIGINEQVNVPNVF